MADLKATIKESWKTIITDLKDEIDEAVQETRTIVKEGWKEKIECQVNRVLNSNKVREMKLEQRAFDKMKRSSQEKRTRENYLTHLINLRMQSNIGVKIINRYEANR